MDESETGSANFWSGKVHCLWFENVLRTFSSAQPEGCARETADLLARTAVLENGLANWPIYEGRDLMTRGNQIRLQPLIDLDVRTAYPIVDSWDW